MANIKQLSARPDDLAPGHRLCGGCGASMAVRQVLMGRNDYDVVCCSATGCLEVSTSIYPDNAWNVPFIHNAFANAGATISGVEAAYKGLQRAGKIPAEKKIKFVAFGGDGGTYDIGLQSLSGAMERGHDIVYVCYDNGAYMNTGIQRSSATPKGAWATTSEVGKEQQGKPQSGEARLSPEGLLRQAKRGIQHAETRGILGEQRFTIHVCPEGQRRISQSQSQGHQGKQQRRTAQTDQ